jgi:hypothetical protein
MSIYKFLRNRVVYTRVDELETDQFTLMVGRTYQFYVEATPDGEEPNPVPFNGMLVDIFINRQDEEDIWLSFDVDNGHYFADFKMDHVAFEVVDLPVDEEEVTEADELAHAAMALDTLARLIHKRNVDAGWWSNLATGQRKERNMGELLCLVHSEISEAMEGHRKNLKDDKLPQYPMLLVELVDALIREFDIIGSEMEKSGLSLSEIFLAKVNYNAVRADHKPEARLAVGGKSY